MNDRARYIRRVVGGTLLVVALLLLAQCDLVGPVEERQLVVEAFFRSGEPLGPLTLRTTQPLHPAAGDTTVPATGAEIALQLNGERITYHPVDSTPGRYAPDSPETVAPRAALALTAHWQGRTATAADTVPPPIRIDEVDVDVPPNAVQAIDVDSLRRDSLDIPAEQVYIYPIEVTVAWTTDFPEVGPDSVYWIRPQLKPYISPSSSRVLGFFLQPEAVIRERTVARRDGRRHWTGVYAVPVDSADDPLLPHQLRVSLVRGGSDFAAFATSRGDPDRREPISNVRGAVGIAVAVALDSLRIDVGDAP